MFKETFFCVKMALICVLEERHSVYCGAGYKLIRLDDTTDCVNMEEEVFFVQDILTVGQPNSGWFV